MSRDVGLRTTPPGSLLDARHWQNEILDLVDDPSAKREDVAMIYGAALRCEVEGVDWPLINRAIIERWSKSALVYIKQWAWRRG